MSARIKVVCEVKVYEDAAEPKILVHSHWNDCSRVILEIDDKKFTVIALDLITAINNATNSG